MPVVSSSLGAGNPKRARRVTPERLGLADPQSPQKEAKIDPLKYNVIDDPRVYVAGDAWPMPFSKSGNTANSEGKYVAKVIAARARGKEIEWESPHTICYSAVSAKPLQAISVDAVYKYDPKAQSFAFDKVKLFEKWGSSVFPVVPTISWGCHAHPNTR